MRDRTRRALRCVVPLVVVAPVAACGVRPTGVIGSGAPVVAQEAVPQTTVYLARGERLVPVRRVAFPGAPQAALIALWQQGAKVPEDPQGMSNPLAELDEFHAIFNRGDLAPGVLMASFSSVRPVTDLLRAQIVCSGTAQPGVQRVQLAEQGASVLGRPLRCSSFRRYLAG
ncbi:hypothetical protein [Actinoallomurus sp. CA-150999]|uniref:hypothetical protein n=1 Tax=Actinoallomurus sp. CA-150999 TaxID=3239887 RepID=UPI003D8E47BD